MAERTRGADIERQRLGRALSRAINTCVEQTGVNPNLLRSTAYLGVRLDFHYLNLLGTKYIPSSLADFVSQQYHDREVKVDQIEAFCSRRSDFGHFLITVSPANAVTLLEEARDRFVLLPSQELAIRSSVWIDVSDKRISYEEVGTASMKDVMRSNNAVGSGDLEKPIVL